ncbi:glutamine synthetase [Alicyclobacillus cycloheptanicus]|uniref:Glutamine synthetase n=1 Tax=Alicyclobacillus cycloheptanicus TaxID=1457 RepID=A0ABT9XIA1_9BACL|nr:glutamine synthetase family protein [Alicyclobacillus cycloheptanicus]MDQ0189498.1 glutamine synthetase [Alicyclobacillus cycloheptanicus]WDM01562.1 glutamine synthetase [Alicyclobacillus cycloheptanicus]
METQMRESIMGLDHLTEQIRAGEIETLIVAFCDMQGRLVGKRLTGQYVLDHVIEDGVHFCVYLLGTDMEMDTPAGFPDMGWEQGYGDWTARPDWSTVRILPWHDKTALVLSDVTDHQGNLVEPAPRTVLRRQLERAAGLGFTVKLATELEFYLLDESYDAAHAKQYHNLALAGTYNEDYQLLQASRNEPFYAQLRKLLSQAGIPIEGTKGEAGVAQHEINAYYADALEAADRHVLLKHSAKEIAMQNGRAVSFMAKPDHTWTGSSSHIHLSLWDANGGNAFYEASSTCHEMSAAMRHFLAGLIVHTRELSILFAPYVNSYKRFITSSWAPTHIVWGVDNRTCGLRVVGHGHGKRIENRFPGADTNPYLASAAMLAAGLDGIEHRLELPPAWSGNGYSAQGAPTLPSSLHEAIQAFEQSEFALRVFGKTVYQHYLNAAKVEQRAYDQVVTNWEKQRYFERA